MALATNTTEGEIVLSGDLAGSSMTPQLRASGVNPETYLLPTIVVDNKGRVISAVSGYSGAASSTTLGFVKVGTHLTIDTNGILSINLAHSDTTFGLVKSNNTNNITISSGLIDVGSNIPKLNTQNTHSKNSFVVNPLTPVSNAVSWNGNLGNMFSFTMTANTTLNNPTNLVQGTTYYFFISNSSNYTLNYQSNFKFKNETTRQPEGNISILCCFPVNASTLYSIMLPNFV